MRQFMMGSICSVLLLLAVSIMGVQPAQAQQSAEEVRQDVQTPVALTRLEDAGAPAEAIEQVARALNQGQVSGRDFNETMRQTPDLAAQLEGFTNVGPFVQERLDEGLRGEELAQSVHGYLNEQGVPAGGLEGQGPPPIANDFIPESARAQIQQARQQDAAAASNRPTTTGPPANRPGSPGGTGGPPGSAGGPPASAGGGPPAGTPGR